MCFAGTWLDGNIPDSALHQQDFTLHQADHMFASLTQTGCELWFYANRWCCDTKELSCIWSPESEALKCRPLYLLRDFSLVILITVCIQPQASALLETQHLATHIMQIEDSYPLIYSFILGDFNHISLNKSLPRYKKQIHVSADSCFQREQNFKPVLQRCLWSISFRTV